MALDHFDFHSYCNLFHNIPCLPCLRTENEKLVFTAILALAELQTFKKLNSSSIRNYIHEDQVDKFVWATQGEGKRV